MDKSLYLSMTAATNVLLGQAAVSSNLANSDIPAFRSDFEQFRSMPVFGDADSYRLTSLGMLAAGFAHELNTPLATVLACVEGMLSRRNDRT